MRKVLMVSGVVLLCLPMLFVGWLLLATHWPTMDRTTVLAPLALRQVVASIIMQKAGYGKKSTPVTDRTLRLDPENAEAWQRRCSASAWDDATPSMKDCETAVKFDHQAADYYNLGRAQQAAGDPCTAEDSFTQAAGLTSANPDSDYLEAMARAALTCGHLPASRAGFEAAIEAQQKQLNEPDMEDEEIDDAKKGILADQEYLVIVYHWQHEDTLAGQTCTAAHPGWKVCRCDLDPKGIPACTQG